MYHHIQLYLFPRVLNSGPHVWKRSSLPTEQSPQTPKSCYGFTFNQPSSQSINQYHSTNQAFTELQRGGKHYPRCSIENKKKKTIHPCNESKRGREPEVGSLGHELGSEVLGCLEEEAKD